MTSTRALPQDDQITSLIIALFASTLIAGGFALWSQDFHHWFVIPVLGCGVLGNIDAVRWCRGDLPVFDPEGLMGLFTAFSLFLAPLLHVAWNLWMWEVVPPPDWRDWLGQMAILNIAGLLFYRVSKSYFRSHGPVRQESRLWQAEPSQFWLFIAAGLAVTAALQAWVYLRLGGIAGYIESFHKNQSAFDGMGWIFMISESFPILLAFAYIAYASRRPEKQTWLQLGLFIAVFFVVRMLFGGLRGSRLNTAVSLFWVAGAIHLVLRPLSRQMIVGGVAVLVAFMYAYGFYKDGGDLTTVFSSAEERERVGDAGHRSLQGLFLGDLARADVQAYLLYKFKSDPQDLGYARGRTYLSALASAVPSIIIPRKPEGKLREGTWLVWGPGTYVPGVLWSTRIYGIAGEAMINFSPWAVPLAYAVLGFLVARAQVWLRGLRAGDLRLLIAPFIVYLCIWTLNGDSDNLVFTAVKDGLVPLLVVLASAKRFRAVQIAVPERVFAQVAGGPGCKQSW